MFEDLCKPLLDHPITLIVPTAKCDVIPPKLKSIGELKTAFIKCLKKNGGNVSRAVETSGLPRRTAYNHFSSDPDFADRWREAIEIGSDLIDEKLRAEVLCTRRPKPSLLIYAHKNAMNQKKWRGRVIDTAKLSIEAMQKEALALEVPREKVLQIREAMLKAYTKISLA